MDRRDFFIWSGLDGGELLSNVSPFHAVHHSIFHKKQLAGFGPSSDMNDRTFFVKECRGQNDETNYDSVYFNWGFWIKKIEVIASPDVLAVSEYALIIGFTKMEIMAGRLSPMSLDLVQRIIPPTISWRVESMASEVCGNVEIEVRLHGLLLRHLK